MTTATTITTAQQFANRLTAASNKTRNAVREDALTQSLRHHTIGSQVAGFYFHNLVYADRSRLVLAYSDGNLRDWKVGPNAPKDILAHAAGY